MRSEEEIRRHIANLRTCQMAPCDCAGSKHEMECEQGGRMMEAAIQNLLWACGDTTLDRHVEVLAQGAADFRLEGQK